MKKNYIVVLILCLISKSFSQTDITKYHWPTPPFNSSRGLTATFGEFRDTGSSDHFHNAVDIGEPDGNPVYPCIDGIVHYFSNNGYDSYINVKSTINGKKKHLTYYHVVPSPSLSVGQSVTKGESIIGTIYVGAAHVHLIEREFMELSSSSMGNEINPVRPEGGLDPYYDNYSPSINSASLTFYKDKTLIKIPSDQLKGKVDIKIEVREKNGPAFSHGNNGTYLLGYRVLSESGNSTIFEPENSGIKYRFYFIPSDSYVHNVFIKNVATLSDPIYWLTNGNGEKQINSTFSVPNNYLDTDLLDAGTYQLEIFSEDTRGNKTSKRFPFSVVKEPPELKSVIVNSDSINIKWSKYNLPSLRGYRIYYSDLNSNDWNLVAHENSLNGESTSISFTSSEEFLTPTSDNKLKYYITAVDSFNTESTPSDVYSSAFVSPNALNTLIVDGFDRYGGTGSWTDPNHNFNITYAETILNSQFNTNISSCSNESIIEEEIELMNYDLVVWFVGDESIFENTFINIEQYKIAQYLENGGKLFVSGEDIGQDLDTKHNYNEFSDTLFYHQYLKSKLVHDGLDLLFEVNGAGGTVFEGINVQFGQTYPVDSPDDIEPINGAIPIFNYTYERDSTYRKGGIAYSGNFHNSTKSGSIVYLSFPFETIIDSEKRKELFKKILVYLDFQLVNVNETGINTIPNFSLKQNYPNPFNPYTNIEYLIPHSLKNDPVPVKLIVYDLLGRKIKTLVNNIQNPGSHKLTFDASDLPSGIYYYQLNSKNYTATKKMILLK